MGFCKQQLHRQQEATLLKTPERNKRFYCLKLCTPTIRMDANDLSQLVLKRDHKLRPVWTCSSSNEHMIYLDTSHELFARAVYEFLNAVAEPVSRPQGGLHQYRLTEYSLYAAAAANIAEQKL